mmetsp:Transcript_39969/g.115174  ORF Transcript_39969/g.115174 Transcript_39969/m.115174 type:complete len:208 (-) Transcript_39969:375-998(-)
MTAVFPIHSMPGCENDRLQLTWSSGTKLPMQSMLPTLKQTSADAGTFSLGTGKQSRSQAANSIVSCTLPMAPTRPAEPAQGLRSHGDPGGVSPKHAPASSEEQEGVGLSSGMPAALSSRSSGAESAAPSAPWRPVLTDLGPPSARSGSMPIGWSGTGPASSRALAHRGVGSDMVEQFSRLSSLREATSRKEFRTRTSRRGRMALRCS